ncbi:MAG: hypothetical protein HZA30_04920 [Candidatus Omnitrophica bacterium]|nr:hypothetical protein [Candidatus Omnitrophota bacterium]
MVKTRYEVDPHNRLILEKTGVGQLGVPKYRKVLDGVFKTDRDNILTYHVKSPSDPNSPKQIKLRGSWSLGKDHSLRLTLDKWSGQYAGDKLVIKADLLDARANELSFAVTTKDEQDSSHIYILKLGGQWQADRYNRLVFNVTKEAGASDSITLSGAWQVNKNNEIVYAYTKASLKRREVTTKTVTIKGYWDITEKHRISYVLNKELGSKLDFMVGLGRPAKRGLAFQIGIGIIPKTRALTLYGEWKVEEGLGLLLEITYGNGKVHNIIFGADARLNKTTVTFRLKDHFGEALEIEINLSRRILNDQGEAFLRALASRKEFSLIAGAGFLF